MKHIELSCNLDGKLLYGHYELDMDDVIYEWFKSWPYEEQLNEIIDTGYLSIDGYKIESREHKQLTVTDK